MYKRMALLVAALALTVSTAAVAQTVIDANGRVLRVDPGAQLVILDNNQAIRVGPNTVLMVDNRPVTLGNLQPGQAVVIRAGESVAVMPSTQQGTAPAGTVVVQAPTAGKPVQQTLYGHVTDVDGGEIKIKTDNDSFDVKVPRELAAQLRKGDTVRMDLTFQSR
jgi:nitrous oxidase accessory protein NosD